MEPSILNSSSVISLLNDAYLCRTYDLKSSLKLSTKALQISHGLNDRSLVVKSLNQISNIYLKQNKFKKALSSIQESIELNTSMGDLKGLASARYERAKIYLHMEDFDHAEADLTEVVEGYENIVNQAEQSARMKQDFLSTMSHEIRTPLNAVTTIAALLCEGYHGEDSILFESLKAASGNLLLVINDILDFTKLDNGKVVLEPHPCNVNLLLQRVIKTYESMAQDKGLLLILKSDPGLGEHYKLDETKLSQILGNLVSNAIKYTETGSVTLEVLRLKNLGDADQIRFSVIDTGIGIPENYFHEMFESFSQPKSLTIRKAGGTGLGLAIVKKLVDIHGSQIEFKSKEGLGSAFYFDVTFSHTAPLKVIPLQFQDLLKGKSALLAEDNMVNAMVAKRLLANWGVSTEHAVNGHEAIEKANHTTFDFILMDIHMPEMNGFEAGFSIRNTDNQNQHTPIFALTADITVEAQEKYVSCFTGFLRKPIEIDKLYESLVKVSLN